MTDLDPETRNRLRLLFAATSLLLASILVRWLRPDQLGISGALALIGATLVGIPIVIGLVTAIRSTGFAATQFYMDQYVVLALAACLATGKYLTGGIVAIVLLFGQMMEERTTVGVEMALAKLKQLSRILARVRIGKTEQQVEATSLVVDDQIRVLPGETIPADATVTVGHAMVDQSRITGESIPVEVGSGSSIYAGTINLNGTLEARVTGAGTDTVMGRVQSIIEEAKNSEAPVISMAEDFARYYTPLILLIATSVFFFTRDIERSIAVLVVSIPCAFVLASPSAMVSAIASASRMGVLIKGVRHLEGARLTDTIVFDKTGTLTEGELEVEETLLHKEGITEREARAFAAALESHSNHPVARALSSGEPNPQDSSLTLSEFTEHPGLGLSGLVGDVSLLIGRTSWLEEQGVKLKITTANFTRHSLVALAVNGQHAATFMLADRIRTETRETLDRLRDLGINHFVMLTGDRREVAEHVAQRVGIDTFHAECLPETKVEHIRRLRADGRRVLVVGDGLNDAPALAEGNVGVAMGALGNDVTVHTSDVALMSNDLRRLPDFLVLSAKTVGVINQNLVCGFAFIIIAIALSSLGFVNPIAAAFFHEFSAFFVIFNSARLLRFDGIEAPQNREEVPSGSVVTA